MQQVIATIQFEQIWQHFNPLYKNKPGKIMEFIFFPNLQNPWKIITPPSVLHSDSALSLSKDTGSLRDSQLALAL